MAQTPTDAAIRLGTRASLLARTQSATVGDALAASSGRPWHEVLIRTEGDDTTVALDRPGSPGLFVSALRRALLDGEVDLIVHSYKDLPSAPEPGLLLAAVPEREDPRDVLVSRGNLTLAELAPASTVGTSSPRRAAALAGLRPDLRIVAIRGNVDSRIRQVRDGKVDATVLALAGLRRLGRAEEAAEVFDRDRLLPAPAQGALAIECRADDGTMRALLTPLDHPTSRLLTAAEREVLVGVAATCATPVAAAASYDGTTVTLTATLWDSQGNPTTTSVERAVEIGDQVAARALGRLAAERIMGSPR